MSALLLRWLATTSVAVALLALAIALAELLLLRWLGPRFRVGLWWLVFLRLLLPVVPVVPGPSATFALPPGGSVPAAPGPPPTASVSHAPPSTKPSERARPAPHPTGPLASPLPTTSPPRPAARPRAQAGWLLAGWAAGALALLAQGGRRALRFERHLRTQARPGPGAIAAELEELRRRSGCARAVRLLESPRVDGPAVTGWRKPVLLAPPGLLERLSAEQRAHVFAHELAHLRHGDVLASLATAVLAALFWFHPGVWLARRRLRAAQESARDWEALAATTRPAPAAYARTLLTLCEERLALSSPPWTALPDFLHGGRDWKRRIRMIQTFGRPRRGALCFGLPLVALLTWTGFTRPRALTQEPGSAVDPGRRVAVERTRPSEPWRERFAAALDRSMTCDFEAVPASVVLDALRSQLGINLVVRAGWLEERGDPEVSLHLPESPIRQVLAAFCRQLDLPYTVTREVLYLGDDLGDADTELRVYELAPFEELVPSEDPAAVGDFLVDIVRSTTCLDVRDNWYDQGVHISSWNGVLLVRQTPEMHERVESVLNRLLNRGSLAEPAPAAWERELRLVLEREVSIDFSDVDLNEAARALAQQFGIAVIVGEDWLDATVDLHLRSTSLRSALDWLARSAGARVALLDGAVWIGTEVEAPLLGIYSLRGLFDASRYEAEDTVGEQVVETIRYNVDPSLWDSDARMSVCAWGDLLLVVAPHDVQASIPPLLEAMEKAFR